MASLDHEVTLDQVVLREQMEDQDLEEIGDKMGKQGNLDKMGNQAHLGQMDNQGILDLLVNLDNLVTKVKGAYLD